MFQWAIKTIMDNLLLWAELDECELFRQMYMSYYNTLSKIEK